MCHEQKTFKLRLLIYTNHKAFRSTP